MTGRGRGRARRLARTGTIIPKMGFGDDLEAAEVQLDACEAKLDEIVRLGRTSAAATRRLGDAEKAGRRALAAAGAAADARVAAADAVWGAIAAVARRAAAAEDLPRATTAARAPAVHRGRTSRRRRDGRLCGGDDGRGGRPPGRAPRLRGRRGAGV